MRLDTFVSALGFAKLLLARQLVNHGHITINNKVVSIPSFQCRLNDIISVKNQSSSKTLVENNLKKQSLVKFQTI
jgi:small subunit ribosomal protein S4